MIRARVFSGTGQRVLDVMVPLSKGDVADRLAKSDGVALDSAMPFGTVLRLFPRSAIEHAGLQRLKEVEPGSSEYRFWVNALENLTALLQGSVQAWTCAQGSEMALRAGDRFGVGRGHVGEPEGHARTPHAAEASQDPLAEDLKWQKRAGDAREIARDHGWRTTGMSGDRMHLSHHPGRPGDTLTITEAGSFIHTGRIAKSDGVSFVTSEGPSQDLHAYLGGLWQGLKDSSDPDRAAHPRGGN